MKRFIFCCLILILNVDGDSSISIISWNLKDLGATKNDVELEFIANDYSGSNCTTLSGRTVPP